MQHNDLAFANFDKLDICSVKKLFEENDLPSKEKIGQYLDFLENKCEFYGSTVSCEFNQRVHSADGLTSYAYLCSLWHTDPGRKKMYDEIASVALNQLPAKYLFTLFEDLELKFPLETSNGHSFAIVQKMLVNEIAKRELSCEELVEMAKEISSAIMFYLCVSGLGYTDEEKQTILNNPDLFDGNHEYRDGMRPLHLVISYGQFPLCKAIINLGGDPDAVCNRKGYKTPAAKIRVDRPQFQELILGMKGITNSMRFSINDKDEILLIKLMQKIGGNIKQIHLNDNELIAWLQSGKLLAKNIFNFLILCDDESYAQVKTLIIASDDLDLKEMITQVDSYKRDAVIPGKLMIYLELQKNNGFSRLAVGGYSMFTMKMYNEDPGLHAFDPEKYTCLYRPDK